MMVKCLTCGKIYDLYLWPTCPVCGDDNGFSSQKKEENELSDPINDYLEQKESTFDPLSDPLLDDPYGDY